MGRSKKKKHSSGLYRKSIVIGRDENGKPIRQYVYGNTVGECEDQIAHIRVDKGMGLIVTDRRSTWQYWAEAWKTIKYKQVGKSTQTMYDSALNHLSPFNYRPISELTSMDMHRIVASMDGDGYSRQTIKVTISTTRQICALARKNHAMMLDITEDVEIPKDAPTSTRRALNTDEQNAIWNVKAPDSKSKPDKYRAERLPLARMLALMTLECGLRRGETVALLWSDVDLKERCIKVKSSYDFKAKKIKGPKTKAGVRKVPIPKRYCDELKAWRKTSAKSVFVFSGDGGLITESQHERLWDTLLDAINGITISERVSKGRTKKGPVEPVARKIDFTSHDLRHTFATNAAAKGVDIKTLQYIMGHEKVTTLLDIYAHYSPEAWTAAARILDGSDAEKDETKKQDGTNAGQ